MENQDGQRRFMSQQEIAHKLGFNPMFITYIGLLQAIPKEWRRKLATNNIYEAGEEELEDYKLIDKLLDNQKPTKFIYNNLVTKKAIKPITTINKWKRDLITDLTVEEIITTHCKQRKLITNNKIKSYNYKFLMRTIPYEKHLHTMNLKPTPLCDSCGIDEDIMHLYWGCPKTRRL